MTYQSQPAGSGSRALTILVVVAIALIAYWASTGGLDEIPVAEPDAITSTAQS